MVQGSVPPSPTTNPPPSGSFAGANNVNASKGIFTDVTGGHNRIQIIQNNHASSVPDPSKVLNKLRRAKDAGYKSSTHETCLKGTRTAELKRIEEWEVDNTTKRVYWLRGIPGSGKSTIAKTFAESSSASGRLGASFFCSRDFQDRRNIRFIFPSLAYYLALHSPEFRVALIPIIKENPDVCLETLDVQFDKLVVQPLQSTEIRVTIIIDALDECEDDQPASAILSVLDRYIKLIPHVKFFITGRPELHIRTGFRLPSLRENTELFLLHEVDRGSVDRDVEVYLRHGLSQTVAQRSHWDLTVPWPTDKEITVTLEKCSGLFIVASVIIKFVSSRHHEPEERLKIMISGQDNIAQEGRLKIDGPYHQVLLQSLGNNGVDDPKFFVHLRLVVGSIVVVFNPLSCASLAAILDVKMNKLWTTLRPLHSIFIVPETDSEPIRMCHKSLADYLTDKSRCTDQRFYINPSVLHLEVGLRCLQLMNASLKKNICELPRYVMNADIDDLHERREKYIGGGLEYACRSWAMHLRLGSRYGANVEAVIECLKEFFEHHLLAWFEVLSIVGSLRSAAYSIHDVTAWLLDVMEFDARLLAIVEDSERFLLLFFDGIEACATHIYDSALPLSPSSSLVRNIYKDQMSTEVKIDGLDHCWHPHVRTIQAHGGAVSVTYSSEDDLIAVGKNRDVDIFDSVTGQRRATLPTKDEVQALTFSPDKTVLVTGSREGRVQIWDLQTGGLVGTLEGHTKRICSLEFPPDGSMVAASSEDNTIRIWNTSSLDCQCILEGHRDYVLTVCWSDKGTKIISGSSDTEVKVWSVSSKTCSNTLTHHTSSVNSVASLPDSSLVASGCTEGKVIIFDAQTGDVIHKISAGSYQGIRSLRFLNRDKIMYTHATKLQNARVFVIRDLANSADMLTFNYEGYAEAISSDGARLASTFGVNNVRIWRTSSINHKKDTVGRHAKKVSCITFSSDGQLIASGSRDTTVKIWDTSTGQCLTTFIGHSVIPERLSFSPDSKCCASCGTDDTIHIWEVHSGSSLVTLETGKDKFSFQDMCFSPSGRQLVSLEANLSKEPYRSLVKLWDIATGDCVASMEVEAMIRNVSFNAGGTSILLESKKMTTSWRLSSAPTSSHTSDRTRPNSQPMVLVAEEATEPFTRPDLYLHGYLSQLNKGWIVDEQKRRMIWVPHELRQESKFHGKHAVFGSQSGVVTVVDFSNIEC